MLKAITGSRGTYPGKMNEGQYAWFLLFMGVLALFGLFMLFHSLFTNKDYRTVFFSGKNFYYNIAILIIYPMLTMFIFWVGFILRREYIDNGRNAIDRFWRRYKKGILPKLFSVGLNNERIDGIYHYYFHFSSERPWHISIKVMIPEDTFKKIGEILKREGYQVVRKDDILEFHFPDGAKTELKGEEVEAYLFFDRLYRTQFEQLQKVFALMRQLNKGEISAMEYAAKVEKR